MAERNVARLAGRQRQVGDAQRAARKTKRRRIDKQPIVAGHAEAQVERHGRQAGIVLERGGRRGPGLEQRQ